MSELTDWCRIVETEEGKVLFFAEYSCDEDEYLLHRIAEYRDVRIDMTLHFPEAISQSEFDFWANPAKTSEIFAEIKIFWSDADEE